MSVGELFLVAGDPGRRGAGRDPLLEAILDRIGLIRPAIAYVGAASGDNQAFFMGISALLEKAGAGAVRLVPLAGRRPDPELAGILLNEADVVFISGGDVEFGMRILKKSGVVKTLKELHQAGKHFIGLSAGSIMLSRSWVRWIDANDDSTAAAFPCLGLAPILCDTHAEMDEWQELKVLLRLTGAGSGYGIPAGAALHVAADGLLAAMGRSVPKIQMKKGIMQIVEELKPSL